MREQSRRRVVATVVFLASLIVALNWVGIGAKGAENDREPTARRRALIIGVDEFPNLPTRAENEAAAARGEKELPFERFALRFCGSGADSFAEALVEYAGFKREDVCVLTFKKGDKLDSPNAPTAENIRRRVREFCAETTETDVALVFFSGHGVMLEVEEPDGKGGDETKKTRRSFLCACDADISDRASFVDRKELFDVLKETRAKRKIFIADCCREPIALRNEGGTAKSTATSEGRFDVWASIQAFETIENGETEIAQLSSCREREFSFETVSYEGLFTSALIEAFHAGADERGELSLFAWFEFAAKRTKERSIALLKSEPELGRHLEDGLTWWQKEQTPTISLNGETERWIFARGLPVEGLALEIWRKADEYCAEARALRKKAEETGKGSKKEEAATENERAKAFDAQRAALERALQCLDKTFELTKEAVDASARRSLYFAELNAVREKIKEIERAREPERVAEAQRLAREAFIEHEQMRFDAAVEKIEASLALVDSPWAREMFYAFKRARAKGAFSTGISRDGARLNGKFLDVGPRNNDGAGTLALLETNGAFGGGTLARPTGRKAFLVGCDDYADSALRLETPRSDVEALKARLLEIGFQEKDVVVLKTGGDFADYPTRANIRRHFLKFLKDLKTGDLAFVYLSGHGFQASETGAAYFAPIDVEYGSEEKSREVAEQRLAATAILVDEVAAALERSAATFRCLVVDACRQTVDDESRRREEKSYDEELKDLAVKVVWEAPAFFLEYNVATQDFAELPSTVARLNACAPGEKALEIRKREEGKEEEIFGPMARSWLEALDPSDAKADFNRDGVVAFSEAAQYVATRTNEWAKEVGEEQTPTLTGAVVDFAFATDVKRRDEEARDAGDAASAEQNANAE